jgi:hypothetical protein
MGLKSTSWIRTFVSAVRKKKSTPLDVLVAIFAKLIYCVLYAPLFLVSLGTI